MALWRRYLGTEAQEQRTFIKKVSFASGHSGVGVWTGHYLHALLSCIYFVNAGVRRCQEPNFGHYQLDLEAMGYNRGCKIFWTLIVPERYQCDRA